MAQSQGKGWFEDPDDDTGKAPRHRVAAITGAAKDTLRHSMSGPAHTEGIVPC